MTLGKSAADACSLSLRLTRRFFMPVVIVTIIIVVDRGRCVWA